MNTVPQTSGIYKWTCTPTGKIYIGSAVNLQNRFYEHRKTLRNKTHANRYFQHAWDKYGESAFTFEVIELVLFTFLLEREQYWLDKLKAYTRDKGFNIFPRAGSAMGHTVSEETRKKMSASQKARIQRERRGTPKTPEQRAKQSARMIAEGISQEHKEKLRAGYDAFILKRGKPGRKPVVKPPVEKKKRTFSYHFYDPAHLAHVRELAAEASSREYLMTSPDGVQIAIKNLRKFARDNELVYSCLAKVVSGARAHHKGWKAARIGRDNAGADALEQIGPD